MPYIRDWMGKTYANVRFNADDHARKLRAELGELLADLRGTAKNC